jgi:hypothetical protein
LSGAGLLAISSLNMAAKRNFLASRDKTNRKRCGQAQLVASASPDAGPARGGLFE